jgi:hypothetical protein
MTRKRVLFAGSILIAVCALPVLMAAVRGQGTAPAETEEMQFLRQVSAFLEFGRGYAKFCSDQEAVAVMSVTAIKDLFEGEGTDKPVSILKELLEDTESQVVRNALRLSIQEIYKESGNKEEAAEQLVQIVRENG